MTQQVRYLLFHEQNQFNVATVFWAVWNKGIYLVPGKSVVKTLLVKNDHAALYNVGKLCVFRDPYLKSFARVGSYSRQQGW